MDIFTFRHAERKDVPLVLSFIKELAVYEKMLDQVEATEEVLDKWLFQKKAADVLFMCENGKEIGYALYFFNFSTFKGKSGLYLEDLFIKPKYRGKGYGLATFKKLSQIALEEDCERMEWVCLNWNKNSIDFYLSLGAKPLDGWTLYRLQDDALRLQKDK